ncbi:hypothetical protein GCM10022284_34220 [Streptomyces hundungensis]
MVRPRTLRSPREGIAVVVTFQDPSTEREFTVTNDGEQGERITVAWTGREVGIHYPGVRPHAYRFANDPSEGDRGLGRPAFAVFLVYAGLLIAAAIDWGWPWALLASADHGPPPAYTTCRGTYGTWTGVSTHWPPWLPYPAESSPYSSASAPTTTSTRLVRVTAWTSTPNVAPGSWTWWSASWDLSSLRRRPWWLGGRVTGRRVPDRRPGGRHDAQTVCCGRG